MFFQSNDTCYLPIQTDGTMITTSSTNAVGCTTPLSQEQVLMDYFDSHISSSPVHANVSTTAASYICSLIVDPLLFSLEVCIPLLFSLEVCILMNMPAYMRKNAILNTKRAVVKVTQAQQTSLQIMLTIHYMHLLLNIPLQQIGCMISLNQ